MKHGSIPETPDRVAFTGPTNELPSISVSLASDGPGIIDLPGCPKTVVMIHSGKSVRTICETTDQRFTGTVVHGDINIIPAGVPSRWDVRDNYTVLALGIPQDLLHAATRDSGVDPDRPEILSRFQVRDSQIQHMAWALKAEMETGYPNGRIFTDSLGVALAVALLNNCSSTSQQIKPPNGGLSAFRLRRLLTYIEENLDQNLSLTSIATVAGLSVSHCKAAFRNSVGMPIHRYVILRRVERARALLHDQRLSIGQVALATGFAHQSHLAYHMRRVLGVSPKSVLQREQF